MDSDPTRGFDALLRNAFGEADPDAISRREEIRLASTPETPIVAGDLIGGRYRIESEVGRGGVGVVYAALDTVLHRDVAVKVLEARHRRRGAMFDRFLEEAQVVAQLEHPGIVPVHEVGLAADGRPYFVMKLLRGRTLASILRESRDGADFQRLLDAFEQACRAVAYAHDRGVVHRDLKPSNIVIGDLGETQVLDWGMSKVLAAEEGASSGSSPHTAPERAIETIRSDSSTASVTGSVFGTPAYMPPEQARGEVGAIDTRSDVFSLGAILCELLTGRPPYVGTREEVEVLARAGTVDVALAAIDAASAPAAIRDLARSCLNADPAGRPTTARSVAEAIARSRRDSSERLRAAEVRAAAADARTAAERRMRRWQCGAAVAVTVLVAALAVTLVVVDRHSRDRAARTARAVDAALVDASVVRLNAGGDPGAADWRAAEAALERARAIAQSGAADPGTWNRIEHTTRRITAELDRMRAAAVAHERDESTLRALESIRDRAFLDWNWSRADRELSELFAELRVVPEDPGSAASLSDSPILASVIDGLDFWYECRLNADPSDDTASASVAALASAIDPDRVRAALRDAWVGGESTGFEALLSEAEAQPSNYGRVRFASRVLGRLGDSERILRLQRRAFDLRPGDAWLTMHAFLGTRGTDPVEALRYATAAFAGEPESLAALVNYGAALGDTGRYEHARAVFEAAVERKPDDFVAASNLAIAHERLGRREDAFAWAARACELSPYDWSWRQAIVDRFVSAGWAAQALELLRDFPGEGVERAFAHEKAAWIELGRGRVDAAEAEALDGLEMLDRYGASEDPQSLDERRGDAWFIVGIARRNRGQRDSAIEAYRTSIEFRPTRHEASYNLALLLEEDAATRGEALELFRTAAAGQPGAWEPRWDLARMLAEDGRCSEAIAALQEILAIEGRTPPLARLADVHASIGRSAARMEQYDVALHHMRAAVRLRADEWRNQGFLAQLAAHMGEFEIAERAWSAVIDLAPDEPLHRFAYGRYLHSRERFADAALELSRATELAPVDARMHAWLGQAQLEAGAIQEAERSLRRAIELGVMPDETGVPIDELLRRCEEHRDGGSGGSVR